MNAKRTFGRVAGGRKKITFLVWAPHSARAEGIAESLGAEKCMMSYKFKSKAYSPLKYPLLFVKSFLLLRRQRPEVVICQAPPIFCPLSAVAYRFFSNRKALIVVDLHSAALEKPWSYLKPLNTAIMKRTAAVLVSNVEARESVLRENGIEPLVLEDRIPSIEPGLSSGTDFRQKSRSGLTIAVPSSFARDEPVGEILDAASALQDTVFYMTGDVSRVNRELLEQKSQNVVFTGFLEKDDYVRLLDDSDAVMALTTRDGTLLAGAYEAVALEKPLITSNRGPLVRYFDKGAIHVDNSAKEIISAVKAVPQKKRQMNREMRLLKEEKIRNWEAAFAKFKSIIGQPADAAVA